MNNIKCIYLIDLLITTIIESYTIAIIKLLDFKNLIIKSIIISSHSVFNKNITIICPYIA